MPAASRISALLAFGLLLAPTATAQLSEQEARGRAIYFGLPGSALDEATATISGSGVTLPANSFACSTCHGERGLGREERGVIPSDLRRSSLSKPYGLNSRFGRTRPAYDLESFRMTLATGVDTGGNALGEAMPRFQLSASASEDLWSYLARLDQIHDPGLTEQTIRIATSLPLTGARAPEGMAMRDVMQKLVDRANQEGGAHGRRIVLVVHDANAVTAADAEAFLWVAPTELSVIPEADRSAPIIAPWGVADEDLADRERYLVQLTAGDEEQTERLRSFAKSRYRAGSVQPCDEGSSAKVRLLNQDCPDLGLGKDISLLTLAAFQARTMPTNPESGGQIFVATPIDYRLISQAAQHRFAAVRSKVYSQSPALLAEAHAFSAMTLSIEVLRRSGRDVSRSVVFETLSKLRNFVGTMTPPLTYSRTDTIGSRGALIASFDPATGRLSSSGEWVEP